MEVFSLIKTMNDKEIQTWLSKVGRENAILLAKALLGADGPVRTKVFKNMSGRAGKMLENELDNYGRMNISEREIKASADKLEKLMHN